MNEFKKFGTVWYPIDEGGNNKIFGSKSSNLVLRKPKLHPSFKFEEEADEYEKAEYEKAEYEKADKILQKFKGSNFLVDKYNLNKDLSSTMKWMASNLIKFAKFMKLYKKIEPGNANGALEYIAEKCIKLLVHLPYTVGIAHCDTTAGNIMVHYFDDKKDHN